MVDRKPSPIQRRILEEAATPFTPSTGSPTMTADRPWLPISTAPKDGRVIEITALEPDGTPFEIWPMQWGHIKQNGLFPGVVGMWMTPDGSITWNAHPTLGGGPTHWREASC